MKIYNRLSALLFVAVLGMSAVTFTACNDDNDEYGTEQYVGGVHLNAFGPSPVARGGELRFLGSGLDQITSIVIPGCEPITNIKVVSANEIRCEVPQTAEPGNVVLNFANGSITTKTKLTYTEPISIESFTPATAKAGEVITIKGEYLNLIGEVIFADNVTVPEEEFLSHSRQEIKVALPREAQTGKIIVSDAAEEMPNWIYSDEELLVVLPSVETPLDLTDAKGGDVITVEGKDLDLVVSVLMPNLDPVDFEYTDGKIIFTLPANVSDGAIVAVAPSGVAVAIANVGVVVPIIKSASPYDGIRGGDIITLEGVNMDQIESIIFPNVDEPVRPIQTSATMVKVTFPAMAQTGILTINLKSGKTDYNVYLETAKPEITVYNPNPVAAAGELTIKGKNLDLIKKVTFGGGINVDVENTNATELTITAPATAESGELTLTMSNGETVTAPKLDIDAPQCAFITEVLTEELLGGELMVVKVSNGDKLTGVEVNGTSVQYIINDDMLYILLPQSAGKGTVVRLISSNGEISYTYDVTPATHVEVIAYQGPRDLGSWTSEANGGAFRIYKDVFNGVPAGAKLVFHISCYAFAQIQINNANWTSFGDCLQPALSDTRAEFVLTADVLSNILGTNDGWSDTALVIQGEGCIVSKVTIEWEISLETPVLLNGLPMPLVAWENHETGPGLAFVDAGVAAGQILRLHVDITGPGPAIQIFDGHWGAVTWAETGGKQLINSETYPQIMTGLVEFVITEEMYQKFITFTDWGYCIIFQGQDCTITKVTIQ